jgi:uncharacterized protein
VNSVRAFAEVPNSETFEIPHPAGDVNLRIDIAMPEGAMLQAVSSGRHPVVLVLDGDILFGIAAGSARLLQMMGEVPPCYIASIGYGNGSNLELFNTARTRDLSPFPIPLPPEMQHLRSGEGKEFLSVILDQVWPALESRLSISPSSRHLLGSSLAGLFVAYAMRSHPADFSGFAIISPRLNDYDERMIREFESFDPGLLRPEARIFVGVGDAEDVPNSPLEGMTSRAMRFAKTLRDRGVSLEEAIFTGETHASVAGVAISRALRCLLKRGGADPGAQFARFHSDEPRSSHGG